MIKNSVKLFEQASKQALSDSLGFDEGRAYYLLLLKKEDELKKEFSYSKRYRLLKNLFELGAVGKLKPDEQDFFNYFVLPPSFLYIKEVEKEIIEFLENIYLKNHSYIINSNFAQIILKNEMNLLLFVLKYFMKESARLVGDDKRFKTILGKNSNKIDIIIQRNTKRRFGIIDQNFAFDFSEIISKNSHEYIGYMANGKDKNSDYISIVEKEMREY